MCSVISNRTNYMMGMTMAERKPMNAPYPGRPVFLGKKLSAWLTGANALFPVADPASDVQKELIYQQYQVARKQELETQRKQMGHQGTNPM